MTKNLLSLAMLLMLSVPLMAQSAYLQQTNDNGVISLKNVSGRTIVPIVGNILLNGKVTSAPGNFVAEFFFKTLGFPANETHSEDTKSGDGKAYDYRIEVTFIQFEDGSSWGNKDAAKDALARRAASVAFLQSLMDSPDNPKLNGSWEQKRCQGMVRDAGKAAALTNEKERYAATMARINSGKF